VILKALEVENYRNIPAARFEPGRELTVICGKNGQGKTNLLEAVWLLTGGKSFRGAKDAELIRENAGYAVAEGETQGFGKESRIRVFVGGQPGARKARTVNVNGGDYGRAANAVPDDRLERLYRQAWERSPQGQYETFGIPARYGTGIDWNEFHTRVEWQSND